MKTSHAVVLGVGGLAAVAVVWSMMHKKAIAKAHYAGIMIPRPAWHPPASTLGTPAHARPGPPPRYPSHHGGHVPPGAPIPFPGITMAPNNIYHRKYKAQNIKGQADVDAWGPNLMQRQKVNNMQVWGSCSYC